MEIRGRADDSWEEASAEAHLRRRLPEYSQVQQRRQIHFQTVVHENRAEQQSEDAGWIGWEFKTANGKQLARFERDTFLFSRLKPYQRWAKFEAEALRLWHIHCSIARPQDIQRVGVRFINRIQIPVRRFNIDEYLIGGPHQPSDLQLQSLHFFHQDLVAVPGHEYNINIIRTIQPPVNTQSGPILILDLDVFTLQPSDFSDSALAKKLSEMRWLKNKLFFTSITAKAKELLQ